MTRLLPGRVASARAFRPVGGRVGMPAMSGRGRVTQAELAALVRTAATSSGDGCQVLAHLGGGSGDCTVPAARAWLRGWGPSRITAPGSSCACATGRCPACN